MYNNEVNKPGLYDRETYQQRLQYYANERQIDVNSSIFLQEAKAARAVELEKIRLDIREKRGMLADEIVIDASGSLIRRKEFLTVLPQKFSICNFFLPESPVLYVNAKNSGEKILYFKAGKEDGSFSSVYINMKETDSNYFRRQLRNSGLNLKVRARQVSDFIPLLLEALLERAVPTILPEKRGFYTEADGIVRYAERDALLWKAVVERAQ